MNAQELYRSKLTTADDAMSQITSGARVLVGSGCAEPQELVRALCRQSDRLHDIEVVHLLTFGIADYVDHDFMGHFRHNAYLIGGNVRKAVQEGRADYTPIFLHEIPELMRSGQRPTDVHGHLVVVGKPQNKVGVDRGVDGEDHSEGGQSGDQGDGGVVAGH